MTFRWGEDPDSEELTEHPPRIFKRYVYRGLDNGTAVGNHSRAEIAPALPHATGLLLRQPLQVNRLGFETYEVLVEWAQKKWSHLEYTIRGRTTGGTAKLLTSLQTVQKSENAPDYGGLIGVNADGTIEGVEWPIGVQELSVELVYPMGFVNHWMMRSWHAHVGSYNSVPWMGWPAGEVLYLGSEYEDGTNVEMRVTHNVALSPNLFNATICGLAGINKLGWHVLWFRTAGQTHTVGGQTFEVKKATHFYVERVSRAANLVQVMGFG